MNNAHDYSLFVKEQLAWATDKWLWVIGNIISFNACSYTTKQLKHKAVLSLKQYWMTILDTLLCGPQ